MSKKKLKPSEAELEILQILWKDGPSTVRIIHEKLNKKREVGYTTTLKTMQRMNEKKLLIRKDDDRSHIYTAGIKEEETQSALVDRVLETAFGGSALKLVMRTLGSKSASKEELKKIREYLDKIERGEK